jgi:hypothetical protein
MLSYYGLYKDGQEFTKISTGCFYFDVDADPGADYGVCAVDADGNRSAVTSVL